MQDAIFRTKRCTIGEVIYSREKESSSILLEILLIEIEYIILEMVRNKNISAFDLRLEELIKEIKKEIINIKKGKPNNIYYTPRVPLDYLYLFRKYDKHGLAKESDEYRNIKTIIPFFYSDDIHKVKEIEQPPFETNIEDFNRREKIQQFENILDILISIGYSISSAKATATRNKISYNETSKEEISKIILQISKSSSKYKKQAKEYHETYLKKEELYEL